MCHVQPQAWATTLIRYRLGEIGMTTSQNQYDISNSAQSRDVNAGPLSYVRGCSENSAVERIGLKRSYQWAALCRSRLCAGWSIFILGGDRSAGHGEICAGGGAARKCRGISLHIS